MSDCVQVLVTNQGALRQKYGARFDETWLAIERLADADRERGLSTTIVALDDAAAMGEFGGTPVVDASDDAANKAAVDAVFAALHPDYLVLVGSVDVIPHQGLVNHLFKPPHGDLDRFAHSDLPYACDAPFSTEISDFRGPTRVVGRIPDTTEAREPDIFIRALTTAATWQARSREDYSSCLGVTASVWADSTRLSLTNVFGSEDAQLSPTAGPHWDDDFLGRRMHFINCHGAAADPHYYGQQGGEKPIAHSAELVERRLTEGTILAAECCYGAELYDPVLAGGRQGICNTYLASGAYGVFGSSTIAYGPARGNGQADVICQTFLSRVLEGASTGRAALEARQDYLAKLPVLSPIDLKTLAQFNLIGHPSIAPVQAPSTEKGLPKSLLEHEAISVDEAAERADRRRNLAANGLALSEATGYAVPGGGALPKGVESALGELRKDVGMDDPLMLSFAVEPPPVASKSAFLADTPPQSFHLLVERGERTEGPILMRVIVAREEGARIVSVKEVYAR